MANQDSGFDYPGYDYAAQRTKISRSRALLDALRQQGSEPLQTNRMAGGYVIPISPFEGLAKIAQTGVSAYGEKDLEKQQTDLATKAQGDYREALSKALKGSGLEQGEIDSLTAAGSNPMAANLMPFITGIAQQKRQMKMLQDWLGQGGQGGPGGIAPPSSPTQAGQQPGQGTVLAPSMSSAPQGGGIAPQGGGAAPQSGIGNIPVGGRNVMGGAMLGLPGLTELGKLQHSDAQTRGDVRYDQEGKAFVVSGNGQMQYLPGVTARDKGELVDTGASKQFVNPYNNQPMGSPMPQNLTPAQNVELPLKALDTALTAQKQNFETGMPMPKLPPLPGMASPSIAPAQLPQGARPIPDQAAVKGIPMGQAPQGTPLPIAGNSPYPQVGARQPAPGGMITPKAQAEMNATRAESKPQATAAYGDAANNLDRLAKEVQGIMNDPALAKITGMVGKIPNSPGSAATNVAAKLEAVKSQVAFAVLQAMRNASKTGGALGSVSNFEEQMLQNNLAAITDRNQSVESMKANLQKIIDYAAGAKGRMAKAYQDTYGEDAPGSGTATQTLQWSDLK